MIGHLQGVLIEKRFPDVMIDVHGVGYELQVSMNTFEQLPAIDQPVAIFTHFSVREDAQQLFGFFESKERELFRSLIKVSGIGPKSALAILSSTTVEHFIACVYQNDSASLVKIPGIGKKTAERLLIEMRDKVGDQDTVLHAQRGNLGSQHPKQEAINALLALGYNLREAQRALAHADDKQETGVLIRHALKELAA